MDKHIAQNNMISQQLRTNTVLDTTILDLYQTIDRDAFVPATYRAFAYSDMQIPLAQGQTMLTPLEEALIMQALDLQGHETVLEIGTGTGFLTALLSKRSKQVITVDCFDEFTAKAKKNCAAFACNNIEFITGNAAQGWVDRAPYDIIVITGAIDKLTQTHMLQLHLGGKLFAITGKAPAMTGHLYQVDHNGKWSQTPLFETNVPLLIDKQRHQPFVF